MEPVSRKRQLLIDLSVIAHHDAGTGIQRVIRATYQALATIDLHDFTLMPVAASRTSDYRYLPENFSFGGPPTDLAACERVEARNGDVFLGLDLASMVMPHHEQQLAAWRARGLLLHIFLFDMLPLLHGEWFRPAARRNFGRWIRLVERQADSVICQCETVAEQFAGWNQRWWPPFGRGHPRIITIPLSGDLSGTRPSRGLPDNHEAIEGWMTRTATVLMVGTIEPRKGYDQVFEAFEHMWSTRPESAPQLLIVGRPGWKTRALQAKLAKRSGLGGPFAWVSDASDEFLERLYEKARLLLFASHGEGFGLPIPEALHRGLPVLYRDLPELRQFNGPSATPFVAQHPAQLAAAVTDWLAKPPVIDGHNWHATRTWQAVAIELANALELHVTPFGQRAVQNQRDDATRFDGSSEP
jgi:glycosyltransferase involved in cell wall biosynthesis